MPTREHEIWLELIQERPSLVAELLECVHAGGVPAFGKARVESGELNEHKPTEYRADAVVTLLAEETPVLAVIVEIQRSEDKGKRWSWPAYLGTLRARKRCPVVLLVICQDVKTANWCRHPIKLGHPGLVLTPLVLGPEEIPVLTDPQEAAAIPELAVFSAIAHGASTDGEKVFAAMLGALDGVKPERAQGYIDEVLAVLPEAARHLLEAMMTTGTREYKSDYFRLAHGQGKAEGEAKGEAKAILAFLEARGIAIPDTARARITECTDLHQLEAWVRRAATVEAVEELFE